MSQEARAAVSGLQVLAFNLVPQIRHVVEQLLVSLRLAHGGQEVEPDLLEERFQVLFRIE
ncbi:hypothetical protein D9M68_913390 [compost metagenome]